MLLCAFYPGSTGQCHQLLFLPFSLACRHVLIWGWKLSSALSPGNPLGQQCGVYAGEHLVVSLWRPGSQAPAMAATSLAHSPRESCHGTKPRKEALGVEPGLWPPVSMCSLSGLTYTAPELTDSLACARGRQVSEECNGKVGWGTWSPENTSPPRALWAPANYCLLRMQARDPDSMGNFIVV